MELTVRVRFERPNPKPESDGPTLPCSMELTTADGIKAIYTLLDLIPPDATSIEWSAEPR